MKVQKCLVTLLVVAIDSIHEIMTTIIILDIKLDKVQNDTAIFCFDFKIKKYFA